MEKVGAVPNKTRRRRVRISFVMCAAAVVMLVAIRASFAANEDKITICHGTNSVHNPYNSITVDQSAVDGEGNNDHSHHTGPVATSEEVAQQLKDQKIAWGDIIPPFGDYPGLNWQEGQAIWENDCSFVTASDDADAQDDSVDEQDDSTDAQDDSADEQDDSTDAQDDSADEQDDSGDDVSADDSTADDSTADDGTPTDDGTATDDGGEVLGRTITRPLATTGSETTVLAMIGFAMLMVGSTLRFGRFGGREVYATASTSRTPADLLAKALEARSRHWTCRK